MEIQTSSFGAMGAKLDGLLASHRMLLVHPIAVETYLQRPGRKPRKSPRRGSIFSLFEELVSIPTLLDHPNLMLEVVLVSVVRVQEPTRRGYRTVDSQLRAVLDTRRFDDVADLAALLPAALPPRFTTADLAAAAGISRDLAQRMAFCFRALEVITEVGRTRAGIHYAIEIGSRRESSSAAVRWPRPAR